MSWGNLRSKLKLYFKGLKFQSVFVKKKQFWVYKSNVKQICSKLNSILLVLITCSLIGYVTWFGAFPFFSVKKVKKSNLGTPASFDFNTIYCLSVDHLMPDLVIVKT